MADRRTALTLLAGVGAFQVALAAGAPWGAAAWAGRTAGVLPTPLRVGSGASALLHGGLVVAVATDRLGEGARRRLLAGASVLMGLSTLANLASRSPVERLWAPVAATLAVVLWRLRGAR